MDGWFKVSVGNGQLRWMPPRDPAAEPAPANATTLASDNTTAAALTADAQRLSDAAHAMCPLAPLHTTRGRREGAAEDLEEHELVVLRKPTSGAQDAADGGHAAVNRLTADSPQSARRPQAEPQAQWFPLGARLSRSIDCAGGRRRAAGGRTLHGGAGGAAGRGPT